MSPIHGKLVRVIPALTMDPIRGYLRAGTVLVVGMAYVHMRRYDAQVIVGRCGHLLGTKLLEGDSHSSVWYKA